MPSGRDFPALIAARAAAVGVPVAADLALRLGTYLDVLTAWNRTINLTALRLDPLSDEAIDRLLLEPIVASAQLLASDRRLIDVGSGAGSPALPLKLCRPDIEVVLIESKQRKAAFLREALRALGLAGAAVENAWLSDLVTAGRYARWADVITVRAVRMDDEMLKELSTLKAERGRIFFFDTAGRAGGPAGPETMICPLLGSSQLKILFGQ